MVKVILPREQEGADTETEIKSVKGKRKKTERKERQKEWRFLPTGSQNVGAGSCWPPVIRYGLGQPPVPAMLVPFSFMGRFELCPH